MNPVAGLAMLVVGLVLLTLGYNFLALPPIIVGLLLVARYRRELFQLMGI